MTVALGCTSPAIQTGPRQPDRIRIALCQIPIVQGDAQANMATVERYLKRASEQGADMAVFPEAMRLGWAADNTREMAEPIPGPAMQRLAKAARANKIYVVAGLAEKTDEGIYNSAVLISPTGELLHTHRKTWIVSRSVLQLDLYEAGRKVEVIDTPLGPVAILVCADSQRAALLETVAQLGARIVFVPGCWAAPPEELDAAPTFDDKYIAFWEKIFAPAAATHKIAIVGVNGVGLMTDSLWAGREIWGVSLAYGPDGTELARGKRREPDLVLFDLPLNP